jgi:DNA-binding transcriptional LysR family regulator
MKPKTSLDQWVTLKAVLEHGGFAQAAEFLHRSQSTVSYAISQLQSQLGVKILKTEGRKAVLTPIGKILYHRAQVLLDNAYTIEKIARDIKQGWPAEITIVVDDPFPRDVLANALSKFMQLSQTRVQLHEVSLSGALEAIEQDFADIVVTFTVPKGKVAFCEAQIIQVAVAHPAHALHQLPFKLTSDDLKGHLQLVVRDSAKSVSADKGWLEASHRWTVSSSRLAIDLLKNNIGFAWMPLHYLIDEKNIKPLPLDMSQSRRFFLEILFGKSTPPNEAALAFAECVKEALAEYHSRIENQLAEFLKK